MNFWVYILKSDYDGTHYIGNTQNVEDRLRRHNKGDYRYTKGHRPWKIAYSESVKSRSGAVRRERFLKSGVGRREVQNLLADRKNCPVV